MTKIRKAVFPVAGLGTRFLPATKASPKEMLPIVDKPLIQYAVEEAISAGVEQLIFVTSGSKRAIEDHFDKNYELESKLKQKGKMDLYQKATDMIPGNISCVYIRQPEALGLGHAVLCAKDVVGNEPFAVLLADDLIKTQNQSCLAQMVTQLKQGVEGVLAVQEVLPEKVNQYGIVKTSSHQRILAMVEKPEPAKAPSNLAVIGRYVLPGEIFNALEKVSPGGGGEIQLTDAIAALLQDKHIAAYSFEGIRYDCGSKLGFLEATMDYALSHPEFGESFRALLRERVCDELEAKA